MAIELTCACGEAFAVADDQRGQQVSCPRCGSVLTVSGRPRLALETDKFLPRRTLAEDLEDCRRCEGSGRCYQCAGKGMIARTKGLFWTWLTYLWNTDSDEDSTDPYARQRPYDPSDLDSPWNCHDKPCTLCGQSGRCPYCSGSGQVPL